jgi:hypothetical protein
MAATRVTMPQLGESVTEGTIGRWLKQVGEPVKKYENLVEIITDKVNAEVPAPVAGVLQAISAPDGARGRDGRGRDGDLCYRDGGRSGGGPAPGGARRTPGGSGRTGGGCARAPRREA